MRKPIVASALASTRPDRDSSPREAYRMSDRPVVILMTSNGVGMGHLSRQLTAALSGPRRFDPVVFSLSRAMPRIIAATEGVALAEAHDRNLRFEYAPSWESGWLDRKSTRLNSSHVAISYAVFCLKKKRRGIGACKGIKANADNTAMTVNTCQLDNPNPDFRPPVVITDNCDK